MTVLLVRQDRIPHEITARLSAVDSTLRTMLAAAPPTTAAAPTTPAAYTPTAGDDLMSLAHALTRIDAATTVAAQRLLRRPLMAARRVNIAVARLQVTTTHLELVRSAPAELCWAGDFDRVLFSRVEGTAWLPTTWHAVPSSHGTPDVAFGKYVQGAEIPLTSGSVESEVVRRRVAALVSDTAAEPRAFAPIADIALSQAYVVAPVISGDKVIGLLHADSHGSGRPLGDTDRITLRAFADGVGLTVDRLALLARLGSQRDQIHDALKVAAQVVDDLRTAPVKLRLQVKSGTATEARTRIGDRPDDGLTAREREVFSLVIGGATNGQIATRLTLSETTVKSHVKHILRKLKAANRAEAIAQYLRSYGPRNSA